MDRVAGTAHETTNKFQRYRQSKQSRGLKLLRVWVPDTKSPRFLAEAKSQAMVLNGRAEQQEAMNFIESAFDWPRE
jgi:hypothetical protein